MEAHPHQGIQTALLLSICIHSTENYDHLCSAGQISFEYYDAIMEVFGDLFFVIFG